MEGSRRGRITLAVAAAAIAASLLVAPASPAPSGSGPVCEHGAISALGPVDAQGNGDTTPDVSCLEP